MSAAPDSRSFARALAFIERTLELTADEVDPVAGAWVVRTPSLPAVWAGNQLLVERAPRFEELVALAEERFPELPYLQIHLTDQSTGPHLEPRFRSAGWKTERDLLMALERDPDRRVDTGRVVAARQDQLLELMRRWHLEDSPPPRADELRQVLEFTRREGRARSDRGFGVAAADGGLAAMTKLRSADGVAQVEDVYTVPEARGRGHARALLTHVIDLARARPHELIFIVADDDGWPKRLYHRLGFEPIGYMWAFHAERSQRT